MTYHRPDAAQIVPGLAVPAAVLVSHWGAERFEVRLLLEWVLISRRFPSALAFRLSSDMSIWAGLVL
jgi:hypothetical protein